MDAQSAQRGESLALHCFTVPSKGLVGPRYATGPFHEARLPYAEAALPMRVDWDILEQRRVCAVGRKRCVSPDRRLR